MNFTVVFSGPGPATLVSPSGTITTATPTYIWNALAQAANYYLWVNDSTGNVIKQTYTAAAAGCGAGTGTCSVTPATALNAGAGQWWIQASSATATGPWSAAMNFTVNTGGCTAAPPAATLVSPSGTIATKTPTYIWNAVPCATWYYLWVADNVGIRIQTWYTAGQVGCASGTGTCSITPTTALNTGPGQWWIQTWDSAGYGPWSAAMGFTAP